MCVCDVWSISISSQWNPLLRRSLLFMYNPLFFHSPLHSFIYLLLDVVFVAYAFISTRPIWDFRIPQLSDEHRRGSGTAANYTSVWVLYTWMYVCMDVRTYVRVFGVIFQELVFVRRGSIIYVLRSTYICVTVSFCTGDSSVTSQSRTGWYCGGWENRKWPGVIFAS